MKLKHIKIAKLRRAFLLATLTTACHSWAAPVIELAIENNRFIPDLLLIPADTKIKLLIHNRDSAAEEFESFELNREKVILGNTKTVIFIGPLAPGDYGFFGEFNPTSAQGIVRAVATGEGSP